CGRSTRRSVRPGARLLDARAELLVFQTDFVDELCVYDDALFQSDAPRLRVGLRVVDGHFYVEGSEIAPPYLLSNTRSGADHASAPVDPRVVEQSDRVDDEHLARPFRRRISLPRGVGIFRQRPSVREYLTISGVHLVQNHQ